MKSFNQFVTEMQNRENPFHGNIRPSGTYPKNLPYIRQPNKEMELFKSKFKMAKVKRIMTANDKAKYDKYNNPEKPSEIDLINGLPIKKA